MSYDVQPGREPSSGATSPLPAVVSTDDAPSMLQSLGGSSGHFDVVFRGYERRQVDDHLEKLAATVAQLREELAAAAEREVTAVNAASRARIELERGRPGFDALGERVAQMLGLAENEAAQLRADAQRAAEHLRDDAARAAAAVRAEAQREVEATRAQAEKDAVRLRAGAEEQRLAARTELEKLDRERADVLAEITATRDALTGILAGAKAPRATSGSGSGPGSGSTSDAGGPDASRTARPASRQAK